MGNWNMKRKKGTAAPLVDGAYRRSTSEFDYLTIHDHPMVNKVLKIICKILPMHINLFSSTFRNGSMLSFVYWVHFIDDQEAPNIPIYSLGNFTAKFVINLHHTDLKHDRYRCTEYTEPEMDGKCYERSARHIGFRGDGGYFRNYDMIVCKHSSTIIYKRTSFWVLWMCESQNK